MSNFKARFRKIEQKFKPENPLDSGQLNKLVKDAFFKNEWPFLRDAPAARAKLRMLYPCNDVKIWSSEQVVLLLELSSPFYGDHFCCDPEKHGKLLAEIDTGGHTPRHIEWELFKKAFHDGDKAACEVFRQRYPAGEPKEWASWHITAFLEISNPWFGMSYKEMLIDNKRIEEMC